MRPIGWDEKSEKEKKDFAYLFINTMRGRYVMAQAMYKAIEVMKKEPEIRQEKSDIEDMEIIQECIFNFPIVPDEEIQDAMERFKRAKEVQHESDRCS